MSMWTFLSHAASASSAAAKNEGVAIKETLKHRQWSKCKMF